MASTAHIGQEYIEVVQSGTDATVHIGQEYIEVVQSGRDASVVLDQVYIEVVRERVLAAPSTMPKLIIWSG